MRAIMILAATAALALPMAANAQSPAEKPAAAPADAAGAPAQGPTIKSLNIIDISELPPATQSKVNEVAAKSSEADRQKMHQSIDASPQIKQALAAKGLNSSQVIVANLTPNGALTLVTKKAG